MENYDTALKYTEASASSAGMALEKFEDYQSSLSAKTAVLEASLESLAFNAFGTEFYGSVLEAATGLVQFAEETEAVKLGLNTLGVVGGAKLFTSLSAKIVAVTKNLSDFGRAEDLVNATKFTGSFSDLLKYTKGLTGNQLKLILSSKKMV